MKRFETLDALRGVAAVAVVISHQHLYNIVGDIVPHAYLAVDFFYMLSGFVMAFTYQNRLLSGRGWGSFMTTRLIRIYPMALLGVVLGLLVLSAKLMIHPANVAHPSAIVVSGLFNLFLLPSPFPGPSGNHPLFTGNFALWSLSFELAINAVWGLIGVRMSTVVVSLVTVASGTVLLALMVAQGNLNMGADAATALGGAARVCFGFSVGLLIYQLRAFISCPPKSWMPVLLGIMLLSAFALPFSTSPTDFPWWDVLCVTVVFPTIIMVGIGQSHKRRFGNLLGALSYPIYIVHFPLIMIAPALRGSLKHQISDDTTCLLVSIVIVSTALLALRFYDEPIRRYLKRLRDRREVGLGWRTGCRS